MSTRNGQEPAGTPAGRVAKKLSRKSARLLDAFDDAAQSHGWESDQGSTEDAAKAKERYDATWTALARHVAALEARVRRLERPEPPRPAQGKLPFMHAVL